MKLKYIYIDGYKNLKDFSLNLESQDGLTMLIGNNGSGKSNVLEALSAIYAGFYKTRKTPQFAYKIIYEINNSSITIEKIHNRNTRYYIGIIKTTKRHLTTHELFPSKIIAIYSGEETRLWERSYEPIYKDYIADIIKGSQGTPKQHMVYINKYYWNIALLMLFVSNFPYGVDISSKEIGWMGCRISMSFNLQNILKCNNLLLKTFVQKINPNNSEEETYGFIEFYSALFDEVSKEEITLALGSGEFVSSSNLNINEISNNIVNAFMPKRDKLISNIRIVLPDGVENGNLSEGEKKFILLKFVLDIVADENSLILLDEPDAHIHEGRKRPIYELLQKYCFEYNRQVILTTHSPTLTHFANDKHIVMVQNNENGDVGVIPYEKIMAIDNLTGGIWSAIEQNLFLVSKKTILLFEGKSDIAFIERAINIFKNRDEIYKVLDFDMLSFNGTGNALDFHSRLRNLIGYEKKVIICFDRDEAGSSSAKKLTTVSISRETYSHIWESNTCILLLPKRTGSNQLNFVIEDYFPKSIIDAEIEQRLLEYRNGSSSDLPRDLRDPIKSAMERNCNANEYPESHYDGFQVLMDKLCEINV